MQNYLFPCSQSPECSGRLAGPGWARPEENLQYTGIGGSHTARGSSPVEKQHRNRLRDGCQGGRYQSGDLLGPLPGLWTKAKCCPDPFVRRLQRCLPPLVCQSPIRPGRALALLAVSTKIQRRRRGRPNTRYSINEASIHRATPPKINPPRVRESGEGFTMVKCR